MNIQEIIVANVASFVLLIVLLMCRFMARRNRLMADRVFTCLLFIVIVGSFLELYTFLIDGQPGSLARVLVIFCNSLEYACNTAASVLWVWYVDLNLYQDEKRLKKVFLPLASIWAVLACLLIGNVFGQFLFSVDENNVYSREPFGYIFYVFLLGCYILSIVLYCRYRAKHRNPRFFPIWMFLAPLFVAILIQIPFYGISVTFLGCSIGLVSLFLNMQSKRTLIDGLTNLYNRSYIEHVMIIARRSKKYLYSGIMLDIDSFKQINDSFGHSVGDKALQDAAEILLKASGRDSVVIRYAGDEFIVLVRAKTDDQKVLEEKTLDVMQKIRTESEIFNNSSEEDYRIVFSMGYTLLDERLTDDEFFHNMDAEMYKDKKQHKEAEGLQAGMAR